MKFSVVIPTYNHGKYLKNAIESVLAQSEKSFEIVVINNYSEDDTLEVINEFKDSRIRVFNFRNYGCIAASRNIGINNSNGEIVCFLDSDDSWDNQKLVTIKTEFEKDSCIDIICHAERWCKSNVFIRNVMYGPDEKAKYNQLLLRGNCISTSAMAVKKKCLFEMQGFSEEQKFNMVEDYELWLRLSKRGYQFKFITDVLGTYNIHRQNSSRAVFKQMSAEISVLKLNFLSLYNHKLPLWRLGVIKRMLKLFASYFKRYLYLKIGI